MTPVQLAGRRLLTVLPSHPGGRSAATCTWKCGNACSQEVPNTSDNPTFAQIVNANASRRTMLRAGLITATLAGVGAAAAEPAAAGGKHGRHQHGPKGLSSFTSIDAVPAGTDKVVVPPGYSWEPVISWGDPIVAGAPEFDFDNHTSAAQAGQFGYNNDYVGVFKTRGNNRALLVANNEYTNNELMFHGYTTATALSDDQVKVTMYAHGMSIVEISRRDANAPWRYLKAARLNRRLTAVTPFRFTGPAAGSKLVRTNADPRGTKILGTFANCAGGMTPWGTVLSGEENFNFYFTQPAAAPDTLAGSALKRYGLAGGTPAQHNWDRLDSRFDLTKEPNEANRFGYIVEVDPFDPSSTPRKHSALGRFKHEGANVVIAKDGHVVAYMGDDERFDYMYKFVSKKKFRKNDRKHNLTLLEEGDLFVAKFTGDGAEDGLHDGTGQWLPLVVDGRSKVPGMSVEEVLVYTRLAADKVGPTKMDRPEDVEVNLVNGRVYAALTNNTRRTAAQVDEANPRPDNKHGHIIEITPNRDDHTRTDFTWRLVLIAGDPKDASTYFLGYDKSQVSSISCPDNIAFDGQGNLWIATDGNALGNCDGMYMMPLAGKEAGHLKQFLSVPAYSECCGPLVCFDEKVVFAAIQHPGEETGATTAAPLSLFPYRGNTQPRPAVIAIRPTSGPCR